MLIGDHLFHKYRSPDQPFIWFPWFGSFDEKSIRTEIVTDELKQGRKEPSKTFVDDQVRDRTPECFVSSGDKIVICNVERIPIGDFFEHPHHAEIRFAHLEIIRPNEAPLRVRTPIRFIGRTAMTRASGMEYLLLLTSSFRAELELGRSWRG